MADSERDVLAEALRELWPNDPWIDAETITVALAARGWRLVPSAGERPPGWCGDPSPHESHDDEGTAAGRIVVHTCPGSPGLRAAQPSAEPLGLDVREALAAANRIITMMRNHLAKDHPDCAYTVLDILNDSQRAALASEPDRPGVGEAPWDEADGMCPNCITPWKCNGPHLSEQTVAARRAVEGSARDGG